MPLRRQKQGQHESAIGLDLGTHQVKAVVVARTENGLGLQEYAVAPTPASFGKAGAEAQFGAELQQFISRLKTTERRVFVSASCSSATISEVELPRMSLDEAREVLRLNSTRYLRRDLTDHYLDTVELGQSTADAKTKKPANMRLLVATASKDEVRWLRTALLAAKLRTETIELPAVAVINGFLVSHREMAEKEVVLLLDIGARVTSLSFLQGGEPVMTRLVDYGGGRISEYISQVLALPAGEAEAAKRAFADEVQPLVQASLFLLGREIRSSIDFFERQHECHVAHAFAGGGTACGPGLLKFLGESAGAHIEAWNPLQGYQTDKLEGVAELAALAPALGAAVGVAAAHVQEAGGTT